MSGYINEIKRKLDGIVAMYKVEIIKTETPYNNQGYGFLSSGRKNEHTLKNGNVLCEGLSFSPSKAATIGYAVLMDKDGELIKQIL